MALSGTLWVSQHQKTVKNITLMHHHHHNPRILHKQANLTIPFMPSNNRQNTVVTAERQQPTIRLDCAAFNVPANTV